jgi:hypothetical protein
LTRALVLLALVAACRSGGVAPLPGPDMAPPPPPCSSQKDCLGCCTGRFPSGALDYDSAIMSCACTGPTCATACASTVCGQGVGIDAPCRDCIAGTTVDGGACMSTLGDCLVNAGPCANYVACVASCPR